MDTRCHASSCSPPLKDLAAGRWIPHARCEELLHHQWSGECVVEPQTFPTLIKKRPLVRWHRRNGDAFGAGEMFPAAPFQSWFFSPSPNSVPPPAVAIDDVNRFEQWRAAVFASSLIWLWQEFKFKDVSFDLLCAVLCSSLEFEKTNQIC